MDKRVSSRAIIIENGKLVSMYREKNGRVYYTFPGGGINENESEEDCVKRECFEEFGITVEPIKKLYEYEDTKTIQNYFLCKWTAGELGTGNGEEFSQNRDKGVYIPTLIDVEKLTSLPLVPKEVSKEVFDDYFNANFENVNKVKKIQSDF